MPRRKARFMIGLFVTVGMVIGVTAFVWLGASKYFQKGIRYVTYFDESVQGLQIDSAVKYRGVEVGNVERIGVAPDNQLVEVVIKIALEGDVENTIVAQLKAAGITGIVFVELDRREPGEQIFRPPVRMNNYPAIPSKESQAKQLLSSIDRIMHVITQVDIKGIGDHIMETSHAIEAVFAGPEMKDIVKNLDSTTASLDKSLYSIERIMASGKVETIMAAVERGVDETRQGIDEARKGIGEARQGLGEARETIGEAGKGLGEVRLGIAEAREGIADIRKLLASVEKEVGNLKAAEIAGESKRLIDNLDRRTKVMASDLRMTAADFRVAMEDLRMLINRLKANPSDLLFSQPLPDDHE